MSSPNASQGLCSALQAIHSTPPQLIATPSTLHSLAHGSGGVASSAPPTPGGSGGFVGGVGLAAKRRASVAIIIRIKPASPTSGEAYQASNSSQASEASPVLASNPSSPPASSTLPPSATIPPCSPTSSSTTVPPTQNNPNKPSLPSQLSEFFSLPWVQTGTPELLFIKRSKRPSDRFSSHVAFPGGRMEADDEDGLFTALRETWEEVGLDLAEKEYLHVGQLDDREITTSLGKRLLMILSPFVFLHTSPHCPVPDLQTEEVASAHWIPLSLISGEGTKWGEVTVDISSRLAPKRRMIRWILKALVGNMYFQSVLLPNKPCVGGEGEEGPDADGNREELRLWGLTLGMTLVRSHSVHIFPTSNSPPFPATYPFFANTSQGTSNRPLSPTLSSTSRRSLRQGSGSISTLEVLNALPPEVERVAPPSMTSIFPRFTYPDINFLIWVFGFRYRRLVRKWNSRTLPPSSLNPQTPGLSLGPDRRVSWAGMALGQFYTAVRKALVVAVVGRAVGLMGLVGGLAWLAKERRRRRGLLLR